MTASTVYQRSPGKATRLRRLTVLGATLAVLATAACGTATTETPAAGGAGAKAPAPKAAAAVLDQDQYLANAKDFVDAAKWDAAPKVRIELGEMFFKPKDVTLEAGKPYVIELVNTGKVKHEFTADKFFRSVATRKVENVGSEVKVPYFTETEVLAGKTLELFVIPVVPGSFEMLCQIPGHLEAGMKGTITVTGSAPTAPAPVLASVKAAPWLQNGPALVKAASATWDTKKKTIRIEAGENGGKMFFKPKNIALKVGTPYVLELANSGKLKHEFTAEKFFPTMAFRKAEDASGEYKAPMLREAEVKSGQQLDLYLIPTKPGTYDIICEIPGHKAAGMFGTITVTK
jgi:uncharacterized cupredoxin-like copper-binding protein